MSRTTWVAFDFDGTLTRRDTLLPFLRFGFGSATVALALARESPTLLGYAGGWVANDVAKQRLLSRVLCGVDQQALHELGERFARSVGPGRLRQDVVGRLRDHLDAGHRCVLVTASLALYTQPWALSMGFSEVLATNLEFDSSKRATGAFAGGNCWGPEKARRLRALLGDEPLAFAYGDSRGDREMLAMAQKAHRVGRRRSPLQHEVIAG